MKEEPQTKLNQSRWYQWRLPRSLEAGYRNSQLHGQQKRTRGVITLATVIGSAAWLAGLVLISSSHKSELFWYGLPLILTGVFCIWLQGQAANFRQFFYLIQPLIFWYMAFIWTCVYLPGIAEAKQLIAHGMILIMIFAAYIFERLIPTNGLAAGLGTTMIYFGGRGYLDILPDETIVQMLIQCAIANLFGYKLCLDNARADRTQYVLNETIEAERQLSDDLLKKILPEPIAMTLRANKALPAKSFSSVTILFADLVGFTALSSRVSPGQLVSILSELFSRFDALAERYGVEKIKTIGDGYMAVAGCPTETPDHATRAARLALAMRGELAAFNTASGLALDIRIGLHSGSVIAGVIGEKRFGFDIWGDAVNIASRMESTAKNGQIQVSQATAQLIEKDFHLSASDTIKVKGKGEVITHNLLEEHQASNDLAPVSFQQVA